MFKMRVHIGRFEFKLRLRKSVQNNRRKRCDGHKNRADMNLSLSDAGVIESLVVAHVGIPMATFLFPTFWWHCIHVVIW